MSEFVTQEIISAGMGGQGVLKAGLLIAETSMKEGYNVSWIPSYGPEMRGGTANCKVVVSKRPVGSPIVTSPNVLLAFNRPSLEKFEQSLKPGGILIYNKSLIEIEPKRTDLKLVPIKATEIADELGNTKATNMVMVGAYVKATGYLNPEKVKEEIKHMFASKPQFVELNIKAFEAGYEAAEEIK